MLWTQCLTFSIGLSDVGHKSNINRKILCMYANLHTLYHSVFRVYSTYRVFSSCKIITIYAPWHQAEYKVEYVEEYGREIRRNHRRKYVVRGVGLVCVCSSSIIEKTHPLICVVSPIFDRVLYLYAILLRTIYYLRESVCLTTTPHN